jgi:hypothetical protein
VGRVRRRLLLVLAVVAVTAGCSGGPPEVTFAAGGTSVTARPAQYCDVRLTECEDDAAAAVRLAVPAGTALQVTVPDGVSEAPWHVVFSYRSAAGEQVDARSPLFGADERDEYTLALPAPTDALVAAQVQQFGARPAINPDSGEVEFPVRASWVLTAG